MDSASRLPLHCPLEGQLPGDSGHCAPGDAEKERLVWELQIAGMGSRIPPWGGEIRRDESDLGWGARGWHADTGCATFPELFPQECLLHTLLTREKPRLSHRVTQIRALPQLMPGQSASAQRGKPGRTLLLSAPPFWPPLLGLLG